MSIVLSAGHYPARSGSMNDNGVSEYELTKEWVATVKAAIHSIDPLFGVIVPPPTGLTEKVKFINDTTASLCCEIHFNSNNPKAEGVETLYYPSTKSKELATVLHNRYAPNMHNTDRGIKIGYYQQNPHKGVNYFLAKTRMTSVMLEPEFISNLDNIYKCKDFACFSIAYGLLEYVNTVTQKGK